MNKKILLGVGFYIIIAVALLSTVYMMVLIDNLRTENEQLQQENAELQMDYINLEIEYENITDAYWHLNNQLERKQGAD
ncbi:hypothetical protein ACFQ4Z_02695 [Oceanobacillus oncorhynchi subsp. oncorhynchi]|uniref:hypothetical protein n=1 Tax=Oceanobacillus oncorhynchi TaxID=545501 RepID=UPI00363B5978